MRCDSFNQSIERQGKAVSRGRQALLRLPGVVVGKRSGLTGWDDSCFFQGQTGKKENPSKSELVPLVCAPFRFHRLKALQGCVTTPSVM
jgi:hypothetical protein